jgi:O-antigen/teichoic acid export membrane protein
MRHSLLQLTSIALIGGVIGKGLRYGLNIVIARGLGPEALGVFALGLIIARVASLPAQTGLDKAVQKFIPVYINRDDSSRLSGLLLVCLLTPILLGFCITALLFFSRNTLSQTVGIEITDITFMFLLAIPLFAFFRVSVYATKGFQETKFMVFSRDIVQTGLAVLFAIIGGFALNSISAVVLGYLVSLVFGSALALYFIYGEVRDRITTPDIELWTIFSFSLPLTVVAANLLLISWADILVLGIYVPNADIGWYHAGYQTAALLPILLNAVNGIFPPFAAGLYESGANQRLNRAFSAVTKWLTYFSLLGCAYLIVYADLVLSIFGAATPEAVVVLQILAIAQALNTITGPVGSLLQMTGYERVETLNTVFVAALNIVLNFILIQRFGIIGAAIATGFSIAVFNIAEIVEIYVFHGFLPYNRNYLRGGIVCLLAIVILLTRTVLGISSLFGSVLIGSTALLAFLTGMWHLGLDENDDLLLRSLE